MTSSEEVGSFLGLSILLGVNGNASPIGIKRATHTKVTEI